MAGHVASVQIPICRQCPHRATLSPVKLQNLAYITKQSPLRSGDRGDGWNLLRSGDREDMAGHVAGVHTSHMPPVSAASQMSPVSSPRDVKHFEITKFSLYHKTKTPTVWRPRGWLDLPWSGDWEDG
jgi:hypothetical protein